MHGVVGKVCVLGVEYLLPISALIFPVYKNTPILYNLGVKKNHQS